MLSPEDDIKVTEYLNSLTDEEFIEVIDYVIGLIKTKETLNEKNKMNPCMIFSDYEVLQ